MFWIYNSGFLKTGRSQDFKDIKWNLGVFTKLYLLNRLWTPISVSLSPMHSLGLANVLGLKCMQTVGLIFLQNIVFQAITVFAVLNSNFFFLSLSPMRQPATTLEYNFPWHWCPELWISKYPREKRSSK